MELLYVSEIMSMNARVRFADGDPAGATNDLMALLEFSERGNGSLLIEVLNGAFFDRGLAYETLRTGLHQLSLEDCHRLRRYFESEAAKPAPEIASSRDELSAVVADVPKIFDQIVKLEDWAEIPPEMRELNADQKEYYVEKIRAGLVRYQSEIDAMFAEGERNWRDMSFSDSDPIVEFAVNYYKPFIMWDFALKGRTRLRLAALHCRIMAYKRRNNRFPSAIDELGPAETLLDPASGGSFVYEKFSEQSYRLYSRGNDYSGPIDLEWGTP
jgi:hypothetical protein